MCNIVFLNEFFKSFCYESLSKTNFFLIIMFKKLSRILCSKSLREVCKNFKRWESRYSIKTGKLYQKQHGYRDLIGKKKKKNSWVKFVFYIFFLTNEKDDYLSDNLFHIYKINDWKLEIMQFIHQWNSYICTVDDEGEIFVWDIWTCKKKCEFGNPQSLSKFNPQPNPNPTKKFPLIRNTTKMFSPNLNPIRTRNTSTRNVTRNQRKFIRSLMQLWKISL